MHAHPSRDRLVRHPFPRLTAHSRSGSKLTAISRGHRLCRGAQVANTLKRALLIWLSILYFGNAVTYLSALGTAICIGGVFAYNHARREYPYRPPALLPVESPIASNAQRIEKHWGQR